MNRVANSRANSIDLSQMFSLFSSEQDRFCTSKCFSVKVNRPDVPLSGLNWIFRSRSEQEIVTNARICGIPWANMVIIDQIAEHAPKISKHFEGASVAESHGCCSPAYVGVSGNPGIWPFRGISR